MEKKILETGSIYHVLTRSIAKYKVFNTDSDFSRFVESIKYYKKNIKDIHFARFLEMEQKTREAILDSKSDNKMRIIAYCLMPTHIHLILVQDKDGAISKFMSDLLNSYTRYFNTKMGRKGPLWESRFKSIKVGKDEQLQHLTRYIHLNPVSINLVNKPEDWKYSSYSEYIGLGRKDLICDWNDFLEIKPAIYRRFVEERIEDQKKLSKIKKVLLENYSG